jgi:3-methyladenine DNA glycosylase/8-oxoguanine DNA glycosylase
MPRLRLTPLRPLDLRLTLGPLRHGLADPTMRLTATEVWRASRNPDGPATLHLGWDGRSVEAAAWGPGAEWELAHLPELLGETDRPEDLVPRDALVAELARRLPGLRLCRTNRVVEALVPAVLEQKVSGLEAHRAWGALVRRYGATAPPADAAVPAVRLPPDPATLAGLPYYAFHPLGLERRRAEVLQRIGRSASALEAVLPLAADLAEARLRAVPGIGPWTAAEALRVARGDPDAVSLGDFHLPRLVAWLLAGESSADDARMLELLEPYRGQRARVVALLEHAGRRPPRRAPRLAPREIARA